MYRYPFAVGKNAYCCWDYNLPERNQQLLRGIDPEYFWYVASQHFEALDTEHRQRAALALRTNYYHGLETLFSLLGALAQAPECVAAWIAKCSTSELRHIVDGFRTGASI